MLRRPKPKELTAEEMTQIIDASAKQTAATQVVRSFDPVNFPVFDVPVNQKVLIYVPNHTVVKPDGSVGLRMDRFAAHPIMDGRTYGDVRCTNEVYMPKLGLDGTCPFCEARNESWDLYHKEIEDVARSKGIDVNSAEADETLKADRQALLQKRAVREATIWYTFPIVVIDCIEKDGKLTVTPKKDADGRITGRPMWYSIRESTYLDKWGAAFDQLEAEDAEVPTSPAGMWVVLNFTYNPTNGKHDKMGSARNLTVAFRQMNGYEEWAKYFDKMTEDWTPEKAMEVVVRDVIRDMDEMKTYCDEVMKPTRDKLAMYALAGGTGLTKGAAVSSADQTLASFGATPVAAPPIGADPLSEMPNVGVE